MSVWKLLCFKPHLIIIRRSQFQTLFLSLSHDNSLWNPSQAFCQTIDAHSSNHNRYNWSIIFLKPHISSKTIIQSKTKLNKRKLKDLYFNWWFWGDDVDRLFCESDGSRESVVRYDTVWLISTLDATSLNSSRIRFIEKHHSCKTRQVASRLELLKTR